MRLSQIFQAPRRLLLAAPLAAASLAGAAQAAERALAESVRLSEAEDDAELLVKSLGALDADLTERYRELVRLKLLDHENLDHRIAHHLYTRSFFLKDKALKSGDKVA